MEQNITVDFAEQNAKLQKKKNKVRKILKDRGVLQKKGMNKFDNYSYFSEAQYKELFTQLLADNGLELQATEKEPPVMFEGTAKQPFGWRVTIRFGLQDMDTGFYEASDFSGIGMDKGDKGIYKAQTGALKYFLATTFMVATGDDPEKGDRSADKKIAAKDAKVLGQMIESYGLDVKTICEHYEHKELKEFTVNEYAHCLKKLEATKRAQEGGNE